MKIEIFPKYIPERSCPSENQYFFQYEGIITTDKPIQFLEYELKMRCSNREYEFYSDHINTERPYIKDTYKFTKFIPSNSPYANLRGILTFIDDDANLIEVELPLTFFKVDYEEK